MLQSRRVAIPFYISSEKEEPYEREPLQRSSCLNENNTDMNVKNSCVATQHKVYVTTIYVECTCFGKHVFWLHISEQPNVLQLCENNKTNNGINVNVNEDDYKQSCMTVTPMFGCAACSIPIHLLTEQHNSMASKLLLSSCSSVTSALNLQEAANGSGGSNTTKVAFNSSNYSNISECANTNTQDDFALRLSQQLLRRANKEFKEYINTNVESQIIENSSSDAFSNNIDEDNEYNQEEKKKSNVCIACKCEEKNNNKNHDIISAVMANCAISPTRAALLLGDDCGNGASQYMVQFSKQVLRTCLQLMREMFINKSVE